MATTEVKRGMVINYNNEPTLVLEKEFFKPGKGGAFNRTKLKGLISGRIVNVTFRSGETLDDVEVENQTVQFSYIDGDMAHFMNGDTFEMFAVELDNIDGGKDYLIEEGKYIAMFYEGKAISLQLPAKLELTVTQTADGGDKGNTSGNPTKEAVLETGKVVKVPLFIKQGEKIVVNTDTGDYGGKVN
ncbi:MAG: elongation factor P [Candidatus Dojkabacteria bacterium]|nr:elongation factor P [Candidatus Dojkabacteria bacterium]MDQ7021283.1 elongation factor P [Candidatus Dojkabacteria bacterium]